ncbi:hypothetical protein Scep_030309 [Stephania cephalantha]|uniref:Uncharacterized protein n=1 Tax=Stephania cephalantha TaxID=152367 RepID=A0AAP0E2L6_9MAGN
MLALGSFSPASFYDVEETYLDNKEHIVVENLLASIDFELMNTARTWCLDNMLKMKEIMRSKSI